MIQGGGGLGNPETWVYENPNPASLDLFGSGCPGSNGTPSIDLNLGNDPIVIGVDFYYQAFCVEPTANPFGAITSNAAHGTIGAK